VFRGLLESARIRPGLHCFQRMSRMEDRYSNLVTHISKALSSDDDDQSEMLAGIYLSASQTERDVLDRAFICLCGWSLQTLMDKCERKGLQYSAAPGYLGRIRWAVHTSFAGSAPSPQEGSFSRKASLCSSLTTRLQSCMNRPIARSARRRTLNR
jgi:hypothetical protein